MVGTGRFELPTCRLGGDRSIHLSYVPIPNYNLILNHPRSSHLFGLAAHRRRSSRFAWSFLGEYFTIESPDESNLLVPSPGSKFDD
jgi:hypothetical protein